MNFLRMLQQFQLLLREAGAMSFIRHDINRKNKHSAFISYRGGASVYWFKDEYQPTEFPKPIKEGEIASCVIDKVMGIKLGVDYYAHFPYEEIENLNCAVIFYREAFAKEVARMWVTPKDRLLMYPKDWTVAKAPERKIK